MYIECNNGAGNTVVCNIDYIETFQIGVLFCASLRSLQSKLDFIVVFRNKNAIESFIHDWEFQMNSHIECVKLEGAVLVKPNSISLDDEDLRRFSERYGANMTAKIVPVVER